MSVVVLLVVAGVVVSHLLPGLDTSEIDRQTRNALHVLGFAVVTASLFEVLPTSTIKAAVTTLLLVTMLGGLSEFAQNLAGKDGNLSDLYRDIAGSTLYLSARILWTWTSAEGRSFIVRISLRALSVAIGALILAPLGYCLGANVLIALGDPVRDQVYGSLQHRQAGVKGVDTLRGELVLVGV